MTISVELPPDQAQRLDEAAREEGVDLSALLTRIASEYLDRKGCFESAAKYVLQKNTELYRRLAQ